MALLHLVLSVRLSGFYPPRKPYYPSVSNPYKEGKSKILEIPVSAFGFSYQGTTMRISPKINDLLGRFLYKESQITKKPVVFLFHPNELVNEPTLNPARRSKSNIEFFFAEYIRNKMKLSNLGKKSLSLLEENIAF